MQYFTEEARKGDLLASPQEKLVQNHKWEQVCLNYQRRFRGLAGRLNTEVFDFYTVRDFHDFRLINFQVIHSQAGHKNPVQIVLQLTDGEETWAITYKMVQNLEVNFNQQDMYRGFDDVLYEEILDVDEYTISHELLFASDASIKMFFPNKAMSMTRL